MSHITIHDGGSIYMFECHNQEVQRFAEDNLALEDWQWMGNSFAVEHRYAADTAQLFIDNGFTVD